MKRGAKLLASAALLIGVFMMMDGATLKESLRHFRSSDIIISTLFCTVAYCVAGLRWHRIIRRVRPDSAMRHLSTYFIATFINMFTPANIGGDAYRLLNLSRDTKKGSVLGALVLERIVGLLPYLLTFLASLTYVWAFYPTIQKNGHIFLVYAGLAVGVALLILLLLPQLAMRFTDRWLQSETRLQQIIRSCVDAMNASQGAGFAALLCYSMLGLVLWILAVNIIANALNVHLGWAALALAVVAAELIRLVPVTVQGVGLREGAYAYLFSLLGESPEHGFVVGTICYLLLNCAALLVGAAGLLLTVLLNSRQKA